MAFLRTLFAYLFGVGLLVGGLIGGVVILLAPESMRDAKNSAQIAKVENIPPKILSWIERKIPVPASANVPLAVELDASEPIVMPEVVLRDLSPPPRERKQRAKRDRDDNLALSASSAASVRAISGDPERSQEFQMPPISRDTWHGN